MIKCRVYGEGFPLLLLHGFGFDHSIWLPWLDSLASLTSRYQVYVLDLPGFGETPCMAWQIFRDALLSQLPAQFAVVGWSMGGLYATRLAIEAPTRVTRVLNMASLPYFIQTTAWPAVKRSVFLTFHQQLVADPQATLATFIRTHAPGVQHTAQPATPQGLKAGLDVLLSWDLRAALLATCLPPVAYVFGGLDAIVPRRMWPVLQAYFPQATYMKISEAAHAPFLSHGAQMAAMLQTWMIS